MRDSIVSCVCADKIINEIGTRGNIVTNHGTTPKHSGGKIIGGNEFY